MQKINSGMGAVILKDLKEHAKYRKWKQQHMDPRNASRTPSASREPLYRLRYESPLGASPSRNMDHQKPFGDESDTSVAFERSTSYRESMGRSIGQAPSYNGWLFDLSVILVDTGYFIMIFFLNFFSYDLTVDLLLQLGTNKNTYIYIYTYLTSIGID